MWIRRAGLAAVTATAVLAGCGTSGAPGAEPRQPEPDRLRVEVLEVLPHDPEAFTQGLELAGGVLYEGTGRHGESQLRAGPPGEPPSAVDELPPELFGEGITVLTGSVWQLTWKAGVAIEHDRDTLKPVRRVSYAGEGWGLCEQESQGRLVMSDGSAKLTFRDPRTFDVLGSVVVRAAGEPVEKLNELECAGGAIYANVWQRDEIIRIDPGTGAVTARIDASGLLTSTEREHADVLNGIAAIEDSQEFLLTGKLWPKIFRVRFIPA